MWKMLIVLSLMILGACEKATYPVVEMSPPRVDREAVNAEIFASAQRDLPIDGSRELTIGILDEGRTDESARVLFSNPSVTETYLFRYTRGVWARAELLGRVEKHPARSSEAGPRLSTGVYTTRITEVYNWAGYLIETGYDDHTAPGDYWWTRTYAPSVEVGSAVFYSGTEVRNGYSYSIAFKEWRFKTSEGEYYCDNPDCETVVDDGFHDHHAYAVAASYRLTSRQSAISVAISGPTTVYVSCPSTTATWTANVTGDVASSYTYEWATSTDNVNFTADRTFTSASTSDAFTYSITHARWVPLYVRVKVTASGIATPTVATVNPTIVNQSCTTRPRP